ncbi:hypothetical protein MITS9508_02828 [Synechococcus sp. MIT S9508]|nr:hypothetical protein MITS9508_02828 [Synechococcus sp. MIT S9508]
MHRYEEHVREHINYLDGKLSTLKLELEQLADGRIYLPVLMHRLPGQAYTPTDI